MARAHYNDDPAVADVPLSEDEAGYVAAHPKTLRKPTDIAHFAQRAQATARAVHHIRASYDTELRRRSMPSTVSASASMSPEAAARFLSPEQLARLFDRLSQDKLAMLDTQIANAGQKAADALSQAAHRIRAQAPHLDAIAAELDAEAARLGHGQNT